MAAEEQGTVSVLRGDLKEHPSLLTFVQVTDASSSLWGPHSEIYNISAFL